MGLWKKNFQVGTKEEVKPTEEVKADEAPQTGLDKYYEEFADKGNLQKRVIQN